MAIHRSLAGAFLSLSLMLAGTLTGTGAKAAATWDTVAMSGVVRIGVIPKSTTLLLAGEWEVGRLFRADGRGTGEGLECQARQGNQG